MSLFQGDCLDILPTLANDSIDLTVTSPPYDNLRTYNGTLKWDVNVWESVILELYRTTKQGGVVVWVVGDATIKGSESCTSFKQALFAIECGFNLHDTMIWEKPNPMPQFKANRYTLAFEYMFIFSKGAPKVFNALEIETKTFGKIQRGSTGHVNNWRTNEQIKKETTPTKKLKKKTNVWEIPHRLRQKTGHPSVFPLELALNHINTWSNENDWILDPFMGSGTTGVACVNTNRKFIGIEKYEKYFDIAQKRITQEWVKRCKI